MLEAEFWRAEAKCLGLDSDIFFPIYEKDEARAKQICGNCLVKDQCLESVLFQANTEGIWGGTNEQERRRIRKRRRLKKAG